MPSSEPRDNRRCGPGVDVFILVLGTVVVWLAAPPLVATANGGGQYLPAAIGLLVCLPAAAVTLVVIGKVAKRLPEFGPVAVVAGTGLRLCWAVGWVALVGDLAESWGTTRGRVAEWVTAFYLVTLAFEVGLLVRRLSARSPLPPATHDGTSGPA